jgi:hypothetical protein
MKRTYRVFWTWSGQFIYIYIYIYIKHTHTHTHTGIETRGVTLDIHYGSKTHNDLSPYCSGLESYTRLIDSNFVYYTCWAV